MVRVLMILLVVAAIGGAVWLLGDDDAQAVSGTTVGGPETTSGDGMLPEGAADELPRGEAADGPGALVPEAAPAAPAPAGSASVSGRVQSAAGHVVAGAEVTLVPEEHAASDPSASAMVREQKFTQTFVTDETGRFRAEGLEAGPWVLGADAVGHLPAERRELELSAGQATDAGTLVLTPAASISGTLVDANGAPAEGVQIITTRTDLHVGENSWVVRTPADGSFRFEELVPATYVVGGSVDGLVGEQLTLAAGEHRQLQLRIRRCPVVRGRVTAGGAPVPGARVVEIRSTPDGSAQGRSALTDLDGRYELKLCEEGESSLRAIGPRGGLTEAAPWTFAWGQDSVVDFQLSDGVVSGRIVFDNPAHAGQGGQWVRLERIDEQAPLPGSGWHRLDTPRQLTRAPDFDFRFEHLAPGTYRVSTGEGFGPSASATVELPEGTQEVQAELRLSEGGLARVVLRGPDDLARDGEIFAECLADPTRNQSRFTDEGAALFLALNAGEWRFTVYEADDGTGNTARRTLGTTVGTVLPGQMVEVLLDVSD